MALDLSRRSFFAGLGASLIAAPAIVRAGSLMPVKALTDDLMLDGVPLVIDGGFPGLPQATWTSYGGGTAAEWAAYVIDLEHATIRRGYAITKQAIDRALFETIQ